MQPASHATSLELLPKSTFCHTSIGCCTGALHQKRGRDQLVALYRDRRTEPSLALVVKCSDGMSAIAQHQHGECNDESSHSRSDRIGPFCWRGIGPGDLCDAGLRL